MRKRWYRALCAFMILILAAPSASAEWPGWFSASQQTAAPQRSDDGLIRVMLTSLGTPETVTFTFEGDYSVENDAGFRFDDGTDAALMAVEDCVYMVTGGLTLALGSEVTFTRHSEGGGVIIAQAGSGRYCGDMTVWAAGGTLTLRLTTPVEEYLLGVVGYEMSDSFPIEALKAQAVAARSYAMSRKAIRTEKKYDVVDTTQDQVYKGVNDAHANVRAAVEATSGVVGYYNDKPAVCYFTASNGGQTALATDIWGGSGDYGYLAIADDPYDRENPKSIVNTAEVYADPARNGDGIMQMLHAKLPGALAAAGYGAQAGVKIAAITDVRPAQPRFEGTRQYEQVIFTVDAQLKKNIRLPKPPMDYPDWMYELIPQLGVEPLYVTWPVTVDMPGVEIALDTYADIKDGLGLGLNGADYEMIDAAQIDGGWRLEMRRFGHGVGMSQRGAQWMASEYGKEYMDILSFYYPGMSFETVQWTHRIAPLDGLVASLARARGIAGTGSSLPQLQEGEAYARVKLSNAASMLNMRQQPTTDSAVVTTLANRSRVIVCEVREDGWCRVRTVTDEGYVKAEYLDMEK